MSDMTQDIMSIYNSMSHVSDYVKDEFILPIADEVEENEDNIEENTEDIAAVYIRQYIMLAFSVFTTIFFIGLQLYRRRQDKNGDRDEKLDKVLEKMARMEEGRSDYR